MRTGSATLTPPATAASAASAGAMCVWKAPATCSAMTRALAGGSAANLASPSSEPAATIWPAPLRLAG